MNDRDEMLRKLEDLLSRVSGMMDDGLLEEHCYNHAGPPEYPRLEQAILDQYGVGLWQVCVPALWPPEELMAFWLDVELPGDEVVDVEEAEAEFISGIEDLLSFSADALGNAAREQAEQAAETAEQIDEHARQTTSEPLTGEDLQSISDQVYEEFVAPMRADEWPAPDPATAGQSNERPSVRPDPLPPLSERMDETAVLPVAAAHIPTNCGGHAYDEWHVRHNTIERINGGEYAVIDPNMAACRAWRYGEHEDLSRGEAFAHAKQYLSKQHRNAR